VSQAKLGDDDCGRRGVDEAVHDWSEERLLQPDFNSACGEDEGWLNMVL
jgi:hypothetical protein